MHEFVNKLAIGRKNFSKPGNIILQIFILPTQKYILPTQRYILPMQKVE